jgi:hypothetical protein
LDAVGINLVDVLKANERIFWGDVLVLAMLFGVKIGGFINRFAAF